MFASVRHAEGGVLGEEIYKRMVTAFISVDQKDIAKLLPMQENLVKNVEDVEFNFWDIK